jgi:peptide/nickel transport system ATP-binding protein/oligopeptide transport system ATP-binding protein
MKTGEILTVCNLSKTFLVKRGGRHYKIAAVDGVSFAVRKGEVLGIVGESGSGKTTVGRMIIGLETASGGEVSLNGRDILGANKHSLRELRLKVRMVFQDPYASLDPRRSIANSVAETGDIHAVFASRSDREARVAEALTQVGLDPSFGHRFPHELSGGQRQRVGIARAILPAPDLIIADEPVSALDVSVQAQVLNLLADMKASLDLTMIFISHDLGVVAQISDRVAVMYLGQLVELSEAGALFANPLHPYTRLLTASVPRIDPAKRITGGIEKGEPPSRFTEIRGCPFSDRCPIVGDLCLTERPELTERAEGRAVACHFA